MGNFTFQGVIFTNYFVELHAGDYLLTNDPKLAVFNVNTDGSVSIGDNGWIDVHDPFGGNAAWIGTQYDTLQITGAADNGAGLIRLTIPGHPLATGNTVHVLNMQLAGVRNATGIWDITKIDANHVDLQNSVFAGAFVMPAPDAGIPSQLPVIDRVLQVIGAADNGSGLIRLQLNVATTYESGTEVNIVGVGGVPNATGQWIVKVPDATHIDLVENAQTGAPSVWAGTYTSGGTCLQYFAGMLAETIAIGTSFPNYKLRAFPDGSLRIRNANIELDSAGNTIVLDPTGPKIVLTSASGAVISLNAATSIIDLTSSTGEIKLDALTNQIVMTTTSNSAKIVLDAAVPSIKMFDSTGALSVTIDSNGTITARTVGSTTGFSGTATVRNAAGTGTSSFTVVNGVIQAFTP